MRFFFRAPRGPRQARRARRVSPRGLRFFNLERRLYRFGLATPPFLPLPWHFRFRPGPRPGSPRPLCSKMAVVGPLSRGRGPGRAGGARVAPPPFAPSPADRPPVSRRAAAVGRQGRRLWKRSHCACSVFLPHACTPSSGLWLSRRSQCGMFASHRSLAREADPTSCRIAARDS